MNHRFPLTRGFRGVLALAGVGLLGALTGCVHVDHFAKGADVGWLSEMEAKGFVFRDAHGTPQDCLRLLQDTGMNSLRLRVWVNPAAGWCGQQDVVAMAVRAQRLGYRILIDFHYSDSWADPGQQNKPQAWVGHDLAQLQADVAGHTHTVLMALRAAGVTPEWVQVGNEIEHGLLWEEGRSTRMANFAALLTSGSRAVKAVFPGAKVIVHLSNGYDDAQFRAIFDGLQTQGTPYDVIGISLYPHPDNWVDYNTRCLATMNDMVARYGKEVLIAEVGMEVSHERAARDFLADIIRKTRSVPGGKGLGVFYWEPECHDWHGYNMGAFTKDGRPTLALSAFKSG